MRSVTVFLASVLLLAMPACGTAQPRDLISDLRRLADTGNAEAIYHLGMAYQTGSGVAEDHRQALAAFRKAASLGDPLAAYKLGCYFDGQGAGLIEQDHAQALRYKLVAAEAGYALAQQDVATHYARAGDIPSALKWLERSAAQGWSGGLMMMASVYNGAPGIRPDGARTAAYFRLFLARAEASDAQRAWLTAFEAKLTAAQKAKADAIVAAYRPAPTPLTIKALSGQRAAQALVQSSQRGRKPR